MAIAQKVRKNKQPRFIEGIELTRNESANSIAYYSSTQQYNPFSPITAKSNETAEIENFSSIQFKYAQLLDVEIENIKNKKLFSLIDDWIDTRYRFGGSSKSGIDCSGFTGMIYKNIFDIQLPRMASEQFKICNKVNQEQLAEGDLVFFNTRGGVSHVGLYLSNGFFVHASTKYGVIISSLSEGYYHERFIGGGRISNNNGNIVSTD